MGGTCHGAFRFALCRRVVSGLRAGDFLRILSTLLRDQARRVVDKLRAALDEDEMDDAPGRRADHSARLDARSRPR
jgi:hypothetical protein